MRGRAESAIVADGASAVVVDGSVHHVLVQYAQLPDESYQLEVSDHSHAVCLWRMFCPAVATRSSGGERAPGYP